MTSYPIQSTFSRGELSPRLHSRIDIESYRLGLRECVNWTIMRQGGLRRRSGTKFINEVKDSTKKTRLIPFVFSTVQAYMLEFGEGYIRVFADGGIIETAPDTPLEIASPYVASELFEIHYTQSADVLYLCHKDHPPRKLERKGALVWTLSEIEFNNGPYLPLNIVEATTLTPSATSGSLTLTANQVTGINSDQGFLATDVGRLVGFQASDGHLHYFKITAHTSTTVVTADYKGGEQDDGTELTALPNLNARDEWRLGAWSDTTGYPARIAFFEERLTFARTNDQPQTAWMSKSGDFEKMRPGANDDDGITLTILAGQVNEVSWIAEDSALQVGTTGSTRTIGPNDASKALTPDNIKQRRHTTFGAIDVQPVQVGSVTLYVGSYGRSLRELVYSFDADSLVAPDISVASEHLLQGGVVQMTYAQDPDAVCWLVTGDGELRGLTYERDQQVAGWHRHELGMINGVAGYVESVATIPGASGDEVWVIVKRGVGGNKRYIERMEPSFELMDKADAFFVDSGLSYSGAPVNEVSGLDHLEGVEVSILADGAVDPRQVVSSGSIQLQGGRTASKIHVGLPYTSLAETLPMSVTGRDGSLLGRRKRIQKVYLDLLETLGLMAGTTTNRLESVKSRKASDLMDESPPMFTGIATVGVDDDWENGGRVVISASDPLPATVLSLTPATETEP